MTTAIHWIHLLAAVFAVGGVVFVRLVLIPTAASDEGASPFVQKVIDRFRPFLWACIGLLLASGLYNVFLVAVRGGLAVTGYSHILMTKIVLALIMFGIAFGLTMPGDATSGLKANRKLWLSVNVGLGLAVLFLSAYLRRL